MAKDGFWISTLDQLSLVKDQDPVGDLPGKLHLVRDDDLGHALVVQLAHDRQDLANQTWIESRGRLIIEHDAGLHGECPCNGGTLLLAAGQPSRRIVELVPQSNFFEEGSRAVLGFALGHPSYDPWRKGDILEDRQVRKEVEPLKDEADLSPQLAELAMEHFGREPRFRRDPNLSHLDAALIEWLQAIETAQQCRFPTPGRSDQDSQL